MKELIDAAVQSAARQGIQAAIVIFDGGAQGGTRVQAPLGAAQGAGIEAQQQIAALQEHLTQAASARDTALRNGEQLSKQLRETQARVIQLETVPKAPPAPQQPVEMESQENLAVATLNLPEKVAKACAKESIQTIGQLRGFYNKLAEFKINQKDRIVTAEALMGRISYGAAAPAAPAPAAAQGDTPAGHTDRPWKDRLKVARFKENKGRSLADGLTKSSNDIRALVPSFPVEGEVDFWSKAVGFIANATGDEREKAIALFADYIGEKVVQEITSSQVAAMLYALGFDPKQSREVDASLEAAGLVQFVETIPATVPA